MFIFDMLCFMSNFSFKGAILYRLIPSGVQNYSPPDSLIGVYNITGHRRPIGRVPTVLHAYVWCNKYCAGFNDALIRCWALLFFYCLLTTFGKQMNVTIDNSVLTQNRFKRHIIIFC